MMSKYLSTARATTLRCVSAAAVCFAALSPLAADDTPKSAPAEAGVKPGSTNITRGTTIYTPSVAVRVNPGKVQSAPTQGQNAPAQMIHLDATGKLVSSPPPGVTVPTATTRINRVAYKSLIDPNARLYDSRDIRAVVIGRVDASGKLVTDCVDSRTATSEPDGHAHDAAKPSSSANASAGASNKEVR